MRFSVLNLLLLGTALAVPIQDLTQASKRDGESLVARGLVPIFERSPAFVAPKPVPKPVKPGVPDAPAAPKPPLSPDAPADPAAPAPLKPNDPETAPPKDTPEDPPRLGEEPPATKPADEPKAPVTNPADDTKPPANNPDDANTPVRTDDPDGPANLPEACGLRKRCVGQAPAFADAPAQWKITKDGKTIDYRQKGYATHTLLSDVVAGKVKAKDPKFAGDLEQSGRYEVRINDGQSAPTDPYLKQERFGDAFTNEGEFTETQILNNQDQLNKAEAWKQGDFQNQLRAKGVDEEQIFFDTLSQDYTNVVIARTLENPNKGSVVVKASFNNEKDFHREYKSVTNDVPYTRPAFGNKADEVGWSDQLMANYRKATENFKNDKKRLEDKKEAQPLKYVAQDNITPQTDTRQVIDGVYEAMGGKVGEMVSVRRTGGSAAESASFDALAGTVHGQRPIQMATDHHVELGNPTVDVIHVMKTSADRYDMVVEFGRAAAAAPTV